MSSWSTVHLAGWRLLLQIQIWVRLLRFHHSSETVSLSFSSPVHLYIRLSHLLHVSNGWFLALWALRRLCSDHLVALKSYVHGHSWVRSHYKLIGLVLGLFDAQVELVVLTLNGHLLLVKAGDSAMATGCPINHVACSISRLLRHSVQVATHWLGHLHVLIHEHRLGKVHLKLSGIWLGD